jgi:hypothetical protein
MMPKPSRRSAKEELMKRLEGDYNKTRGGGSLFKADLRGVNFWQCKETDHIIDIIPYIAGENDPDHPRKDSYVLEIFVHNKVGQSGEGMIICMAETFKKPCPICEERRRLIKKDGDENRIKELTPSRYPRSIYNIVCYDSKEEENKGVQIWHTSNFLFQQYLLALAKRPVRPGSKNVEPYIAFMDLDEGKSIAFKREGKKENTKFVGLRFEDRDYQISEEIEKSAHVLDELIYWPTYKEVYQEFWGTVPEVAPTEDRSSRGTKYEEKKEDPPEEKKEEEVPRGRRGRNEGEEKKEDPPEEKKDSKNKCPVGKRFGHDIDDLKECDKCAVWKECAKEADAIEKAKRK